MQKHIKLVDPESPKNANVSMVACSSGESTSSVTQEWSALMYKNLNTSADTSATDKDNPYKVRKIPGYFNLERKNAETSLTGDYKIHISVNNNQLSQAWDIIIPILTKARIDSFKVHDKDMRGFQQGKQIVIYTNIFDNRHNNNLKDWVELLGNINQTFHTYGIQPDRPSCFRFDNEITDVYEPKLEDNDYCYIRRSIKPETSCCGLYCKSEKMIITAMSEQERGGLLIIQPTPKQPGLRMQ